MAASQGHTFPKQERVCGKKDIASLLSRGKWSLCGVLKVCVAPDNGLEYSRVMVSVPKRYFKRAVKRNLLKRRIREAYRLQKELLGGAGARDAAGRPGGGFDILLQYNSAEMADFATIREDVSAVLRRIAQ